MRLIAVISQSRAIWLGQFSVPCILHRNFLQMMRSWPKAHHGLLIIIIATRRKFRLHARVAQGWQSYAWLSWYAAWSYKCWSAHLDLRGTTTPDRVHIQSIDNRAKMKLLELLNLKVWSLLRTVLRNHSFSRLACRQGTIAFLPRANTDDSHHSGSEVISWIAGQQWVAKIRRARGRRLTLKYFWIASSYCLSKFVNIPAVQPERCPGASWMVSLPLSVIAAMEA